jgi:hypothetical protein
MSRREALTLPASWPVPTERSPPACTRRSLAQDRRTRLSHTVPQARAEIEIGHRLVYVTGVALHSWCLPPPRTMPRIWRTSSVRSWTFVRPLHGDVAKAILLGLPA